MPWTSRHPSAKEYNLAPFSFKKGKNIYGLIFGSGSTKGMEQFLTVAWQKDQLNSEADYDLNREDFSDLAPFLALNIFEKPKKIKIFEAALRKSILNGTLASEADIFRFCLNHAVLPKHASPVLSELKCQGKIICEFRSPRRESLKEPRDFQLVP